MKYHEITLQIVRCIKWSSWVAILQQNDAFNVVTNYFEWIFDHFDNTMFFIQWNDQVLYYYTRQIMHIVFILCFEGCTIITRRCLYFRYSKLVKMQQSRLHFHSIFNVLFCLLIKINNRHKNLYKLLKNALICILILFYMLNNNIIIFMDK